LFEGCTDPDPDWRVVKHQIPNSIQTPISKGLNGNSLNFGHWNLELVWNLGFGILKPPPGAGFSGDTGYFKELNCNGS
jgi:hypothetical protein